MKPHSERSTARRTKGASQGAATATVVEATLTPAHRKVPGPLSKKSEKAKMFVSRKHERPMRERPVRKQYYESLVLDGSGVMAHDAVMNGVSGRALIGILETTMGALPRDSILKAVGVSARTVHRIKSDPDKPLDARTTDGIYRLLSVRTLAEEVLGSAEASNEWLNTKAIGLEFRKPIDLVSTSPGAEAVKTLLQRMKYGVYA